MVFAPRAGVCGDGMNWYSMRNGNMSYMYGSFYNSSGGNSRDVEVTCQTGPVRLVVVRDQGETRALRTYVGGRWKADTGINRGWWGMEERGYRSPGSPRPRP